MSPTTWEEAAEETAATLKRDVIKLWTEQNVDPLNATRQVLASMGDEPGQYPPVQGFRHIAENGIVGFTKHSNATDEAGPLTSVGIESVITTVVQTIIKKQHDYGHGNIEAYGRLGLLVRLSDKCARIENLVNRQATWKTAPRSVVSAAPLNEALEDSWLDIAGYGIIGCMFEEGTFMLPLKNDLMAEGYAEQAESFVPMEAAFAGKETVRLSDLDSYIRDLVVDVLIQHGLIPNVTRLERAAE